VLNVYCTGHKWSVMVCQAFAKGANSPIVPPYPLRPGDVFMYGALRGLLPTYYHAKREGRALYYADNGYFLPGKSETSYFRITRNALQHNGEGKATPEALARWRALNIPIKPWRVSGAHVLVCPPGRLFGATFGFDADQWLEDTVEELKKHTDREIRFRLKMSWNDAKPAYMKNWRGIPKTSVATPLADDLVDCWALVTHSSNAAVEAVLAGVPVFHTAPCGASVVGLSDLSRIEQPRMDGDREAMAAVLAANQWTLPEMRSGKCWSDLCST
jgi:hypothetical protein